MRPMKWHMFLWVMFPEKQGLEPFINQGVFADWLHGILLCQTPLKTCPDP